MMPWLIAPAYGYVAIVVYLVLLPHYSIILAVWRRQIVFLHWRTRILRHKIWMILYHIKHQEDFQIQHRLPRRPQVFRLHNLPKNAVALGCLMLTFDLSLTK